jgi:hypothetical protein
MISSFFTATQERTEDTKMHRIAPDGMLARVRDDTDHPDGIWTLPPTLFLKDTDRAKYLAIGESNRFAMKFIKPGDR